MIRDLNPDEPYWLRVVEYCAAGCLQAVMDEYAHVLMEWEGLTYRPAGERTRRVAQRMAQVLQLRTATFGVDQISVDAANGSLSTTDRRMRARFAARFGARQTEEGASAARLDDVRAAFNSPFWPFVLCTTSVGQEGLDFHLYCHAIVHWNLPSNPVDLEQREGRIHRYKGHAVRKNLARVYGSDAITATARDPWDQLFAKAVGSRTADETDLIPYWVFPLEDGVWIERHVPVLPLSRDAERAELLRRSLAVYRMAFGQSRQDDLVAFLQERLPAEQIQAIVQELRIDLSPPKAPPLEVTPEEIAEITDRRARARVREVATEQTAVPSPPLASVLTLETASTLLDEFRRLSAKPDEEALIARYRELLDLVRVHHVDRLLGSGQVAAGALD
jgi:hypothetical protein